MKCGKQLETEEQEYCHDCATREHVFDRGVAAFAYSDSMKKSMYAFKYNNRREYAQFYADAIAEKYGDIIKIWGPQVIVPVPLHKARLRKRGYNQAEILAKALSRRLGIPVDAGCLLRIKNTTPQKKLNDRQRCNNINNAFQMTKYSVEYKKILLIDDIYTTGATINECAMVMKKSGVEKVFFATVCIGRGF